ncbi:hypothetical protein B566_EDAN014138 [Ephemera danica]|nr:hypothetical protein B566_EDAN014138 [Ephemera danica]
MVALRLTLVLALIFCSTKALFLEPRAWTTYDQEHGQYSMAVLSAETTALRYRVYVLTLEVSHTTKYIDQEIIALFTAAGRGQNMLTQTQRIMDSCVDMATLTGAINEDIASSTFADMSLDKLLLKNQHCQE